MAASSFNMDTLTIECFSSRKTYNKYLAKKDPTMFQKNETFHQDLIQNHDALMELLSECISNPESISKLKMRDTFHQLMIECLDVLTTKTETTATTNPIKDPDDVLFSQCVDLGKQPENPIEYWKMQSVFKS
jgi:hypothetical protein